MDQQDAYNEIQNIIGQINELVNKARKLADEHDVEFVYTGYMEATDPEEAWDASESWYDSGCTWD